jgi:hypothetical protein
MIFFASPRAAVNVTTYHNDNARTGQNLLETTLTPANVNSSQFGKLFSVATDGAVYAQPLYLSNVTIGGGAHNVAYLATEHDSVYAIDADSGRIYWQRSLIPAGGSTVSSANDIGCGDIAVEVGITGTPVIDAATGTLYAVAKVKLNGVIYQYLHALDVTTGADKFGGPVDIQASVPGTASDGNGTTVTFNPRTQNQRPALLLENGHVVIGWSSHCDASRWHGWVMAYASTTLTQEGVYNASADGYGNGIWMSGGGLTADAAGNIFFATGNGSWNATDRGNSVIKLGAPSNSTLPLLDYFTPWDQASFTSTDRDVSAGGLVLLPTLANGKQLAVLIGKSGTMYLLDRGNLGKYCIALSPPCTNSDTNIVQEITGVFTGFWGTPAYWNGHVYWAGGNDDTGKAEPLKAYSFDANSSGRMSTAPTSVSALAFHFAGPMPSISSNGTSNGILWGLDNGAYGATCSGGTNCQVLYAYDATNLTKMLYNSSQAAGNRDVPGSAIKFTTPTIANGKVYVASKGSVTAFGLLQNAVPIPVNFGAAANVHGLFNDGSVVSHGGLDTHDDAYSATLLGDSLTWSGTTFNLGAAGMAAAATTTAIPLPAGNFSRLELLGTGVFGFQPNQTFTVTYTDGTTTVIAQSLSDWHTSHAYAGEAIVATMPYRLLPTGAKDNQSFYLYGYSFAIDAAKTVAKLTLPHNTHAVVVAAALLP